MSSGSWMMPRPSSQAHTRLAMLRVNQGFFGVISQSAKTSRGSRSGDNWILVPSGNIAANGAVATGTVAAGDRRVLRPALSGSLGAAGSAGLIRIPEDVFFLPFPRGLVADLREEDRHARQPLFGPGVGPRSHEGQGHGHRRAFRGPVLNGAVEVDRADAEIAAAGGEHLADELVVGLVLGDRRPHPAVIGLGRVGPKVDGKLGLDPQDVAPFHGPVVGELVALQQAIDQQPALVLRIRILDEIAGLLRGGQRADHVEIGAANEDRVGTKRGLDAQRRQLGENELVDLAGGHGPDGAFEDVGRLLRSRGLPACRPAADHQEHDRGNQPRRSHAFQLRAGGISWHSLSSVGVRVTSRMPVCGGAKPPGTWNNYHLNNATASVSSGQVFVARNLFRCLAFFQPPAKMSKPLYVRLSSLTVNRTRSG